MSISDRETLRRKIEAGVQAGIARALEEHRRAGRKVAIWNDGQVVFVLPPAQDTAESLALREEPPKTAL